MSVIGTTVEPQRVTRVFFDCRDGAADPADRRLIEQAIVHSIALADADDALDLLPLAA
jgi:PIN domain nuclease of toxin-antitoxin system